jgi:hypothetical protein
MPNLKHLTHGISNLVSLITKTKLGLSVGWWDVPVLSDSYRVDAELVIIGGITHWVTRDMERVAEECSGSGTCSHTRMATPAATYSRACSDGGGGAC